MNCRIVQVPPIGNKLRLTDACITASCVIQKNGPEFLVLQKSVAD